MDTSAIDQVLALLAVDRLVSTFVSVGAITVLCGILAILGLFGTGKLIRTAAVLGAIVLILFLAAAIAALFVVSRFPGLAGGWLVTFAGCVLAYVGSHFARE